MRMEEEIIKNRRLLRLSVEIEVNEEIEEILIQNPQKIKKIFSFTPKH